MYQPPEPINQRPPFFKRFYLDPTIYRFFMLIGWVIYLLVFISDLTLGTFPKQSIRSLPYALPSLVILLTDIAVYRSRSAAIVLRGVAVISITVIIGIVIWSF